MKLLDKVALITDASNPCGRAIALGFAREGADCIVLAARGDAAEHLALELRALGRRALSLTCDVHSKAQVATTVDRVVAEFGRIDILLNCSTAEGACDFLTVSADDFNRALDQGPKAYFLFCQAVGRIMVQQRAGKIVNLASTDARIGSGE
jgi:gluconate 5-dehydrogenase